VDRATVSRAVPPPPIAASGTTFIAPAALDSSRTPKPASQPARRTLRDARLFLRGVSGGATIAVDGQQVHDSVLLLRSPGRHLITVTKPGFEPWADTLWTDAGDQLARWVVATPVAPPASVAPEPTATSPKEAVLRIQVQPPARILIDKNDFDPQRRPPLLRRGVDPKAGPRDSLWALGVQYLAQILYEQGDEAGARAWIRWAVRFGTELKLDTLNLLSPVIAEFHSARATTPAGPEDARVRTEWVWPSTDPGSGPGRIEVPSDGTPASLTATVTGRGVLSPRLSLPAGSYEIEARASGYRPAKITREVLPGITTVLVFMLQPAPPVAVVPQLPAPAPPPVATKKKRHFPWAIA